MTDVFSNPDIFTNLWTWVPIIGGVGLTVAILWAMLRNKQTPREEARTERATEKLYDEGSTDESGRDPR